MLAAINRLVSGKSVPVEVKQVAVKQKRKRDGPLETLRRGGMWSKKSPPGRYKIPSIRGAHGTETVADIQFFWILGSLPLRSRMYLGFQALLMIDRGISTSPL